MIGSSHHLRLKRPTPNASRRFPFKSSAAFRALAPPAFFRGPLCFAPLSAKKYATAYFSVLKRNFKIFQKLLSKLRRASQSPRN